MLRLNGGFEALLINRAYVGRDIVVVNGGLQVLVCTAHILQGDVTRVPHFLFLSTTEFHA